MMKSRLFLLLWMCCSVLLTACENEDPIPEPPVAGSRTVLAYLAADHRGTLNNLSSLALLDLEEMRLGMAKVNNSSNMRLLVYIDTDSSPRLIELKNEGGKFSTMSNNKLDDDELFGIIKSSSHAEKISFHTIKPRYVINSKSDETRYVGFSFTYI